MVHDSMATRRWPTLKPLDQLAYEDVAPDRLRSLLLSAFAPIAVVLAAMGLYGVLSYAIVHRTREMGIRAALGASQLSLLALVVRQGMVLTVGLVLGCGTAVAAARVLQASLVVIAPTDPIDDGGGRRSCRERGVLYPGAAGNGRGLSDRGQGGIGASVLRSMLKADQTLATTPRTSRSADSGICLEMRESWPLGRTATRQGTTVVVSCPLSATITRYPAGC